MSPLATVFESSGDLVADRRYRYAAEYGAAGDFAAAADLYAQALERTPDWAAGWFALGAARAEAGDGPGAIEAYRQVLRLDPEDRFGAALKLALLGDLAVPEAAPAAYLEALFDQYAPEFDAALVERLDYRVPWLLAERLKALAAAEAGPAFARGLDLGCGTGLVGEAIRDQVSWLSGVDLSGEMIAAAERKGVYDHLAAGDFLVALIGAAAHYDLVTAADVLIYFGNLQPALTAIAAALAPGGLFVGSVQAAGTGDWTLGPDLRYGHSRRYIERLAAAAGLELRLFEDITCRLDRGEPVAGHLFVCRKPKAAALPIASLAFDDAALPKAE